MTPGAAYTPPPGFRTALDDFKDYVNDRYDLKLRSYDDLHAFSVNRMNDFWMLVWKFAGIKASVQPTKMNENIAIDKFPQFFEDAKLNFAENLLSGDDEKLAVVELSETNIWAPQRFTWKQLRQLVAKYASALRSLDLEKGEVVALVGSNSASSLALLLATASIGGLFASFATDVGEKALNDRLTQIHPRILIAESSYSYNGKPVDISAKISNAVAKLDHKEKLHVVIVGSSSRMGTSIEDFVASGTATDLRFEQVPFNTPMVIMFSSGTTGVPKGIVHGHGGLVLNGVKEHLLHNSFGPEDVHFHFSNIGWTLWNISIGAMFCKTAMVLYDGSPFYPNPTEFLRAVFANGVTAFGAGPRYYSELQKRDIKPKKFATRLHSIYSTGAVLTPGLASWLVEAFGPVCQISFSGGTELCGSFMHGTRSLPSYPGEIAVKELGMDVDVFSEDGKPLAEGESGELVCKKPFPNMPVMFWNDADRKRYRSSYFEMFPHVWTHGDLVRINPQTKGIYVLGRSDGVLNPSGVRFGSSEIYNILSTPQFSSSVLDAVVVGQQRTGDPTEQVLLFIKCPPRSSTPSVEHSSTPSQKLNAAIRHQIATDLTRRHVPAYIFEVDEVPYNANGKKMEIQVKAVVCGGPEALTKLKITPEEREILGRFVRFFYLESVIQEGRAKL